MWISWEKFSSQNSYNPKYEEKTDAPVVFALFSGYVLRMHAGRLSEGRRFNIEISGGRQPGNKLFV